MKISSKYFFEKKINLYSFFFLFYKNKIITFLSILFCFLFFFKFFINNSDNNKISVSAKVKLFIPQDILLKIKNFDEDYYVDVKSIHSALPEKIMSEDNFLSYILKENNGETLKILNKYNLDLNSYFAYNFIEEKKNSYIEYSLSFPKEIDGVNLLNNYIIFSKDQIINQFYNDIEDLIDQKIIKKNRYFKIAKELNIVIPKEELNIYDQFQKGQKVLSVEIDELQFKKKNLTKQSLDWDPFVSKAIHKEKSNVNNNKRILLSILLTIGLGLLLSLIVIFFIDDFKKNNFF